MYMELLKVSPWKCAIRLRKRSKLHPKFISLFRVVARVDTVACRLDFPGELGHIRDTFHVSQLRKCVAEETSVASLEDIQVDGGMNYVERFLQLYTGI